MKTIYLDCETTGLNAGIHGITEIAVIIEVDNKEVEKHLFQINPYTYRRLKEDEDSMQVSEEALEISGKTYQDLESYGNSTMQQVRFYDALKPHLAEGEKFTIAGYNIDFDIKFLKAWINDADLFHYTDLFSHNSVCVYQFLLHLTNLGYTNLSSHKLTTACEKFEIPLEKAHSAMDDIVATKKLYEKLRNEFLKERK